MPRTPSALTVLLALLRRGLLIVALAALAVAALGAVQKTLLDTRAGRPPAPLPFADRAAAALDLLSQVNAKLVEAQFPAGPIGYVGRTAAPGDQAAPPTPWLELATFALAPITVDPHEPLARKHPYPFVLANFATRAELDVFRRENRLAIVLDFPDRQPGLALLQPNPPETAPATHPQTMPEGK